MTARVSGQPMTIAELDEAISSMSGPQRRKALEYLLRAAKTSAYTQLRLTAAVKAARAASDETPLEATHIGALTAIAIGLPWPLAARRLLLSPRTLRRRVDEAVEILGAHSARHAASLAIVADHIDPAHIRDRTVPSEQARR